MGQLTLRVSKKAIRTEVDALRTQLTQQRKQIAQLKKEIAEQRKLIREAGRSKRESSRTEASVRSRPPRFSAALVKQRRTKLGLSQADFAKLLGVSSLTVYNIEKGGKPRQKTLAAFGATAALGKRAAQVRLQSLNA